jgi:hypothetical protein
MKRENENERKKRKRKRKTKKNENERKNKRKRKRKTKRKKMKTKRKTEKETPENAKRFKSKTETTQINHLLLRLLAHPASCSTRRLARGAPCQTEGRGHTKDHFLPHRGGAAPNQAAQSDRSRARMPDSRRTLLLRTHASSACLQPKRRASNCASADARVAASFAVSRASTRQESAPWS